MAKIDLLKEKFKDLNDVTFNRLYEGDKTPTKKYAEFLISAWCKKRTKFGGFRGVEQYIDLVDKFEKYQSNIDNKDIYSYPNINEILSVVKTAEIERNEKDFDRNIHIHIIEETDDYIFLIPKTHIGSLKYGANTKWCTASASSPATFKTYTDKGFLAYLIDKKNSKTNNSNKVAFYFNNKSNPLSQQILIYNQVDSTVNESYLILNGWDVTLLGNLLGKFRTILFEYSEQEKVRVELRKTIQQLNQINYDNFFNSLSMLKVNPETIEDIKKSLGIVKSSLKTINI